MLLQIEKFKNSLEAAAYNYPFYENPEAQWGRTQSRLIIEFVNRNQRAPSAQHQGLLFAEFYIRRESGRDGAGSDLRRSPVPPLSAVSIFVLSHSALLYLIPCACILPPSRPKSGSRGCFAAAVGFSLRFVRGMFPSFVNISAFPSSPFA